MEIAKEILTQHPYFDFYESIEEYGFDFEGFIKDGFHDFLKDTFIKDFITLRQAYISIDFPRVRFVAHKFKGSFALMNSKFLNPLCLEIENLYVDLVQKMLVFLDKIVQFSCQISNSHYNIF